MPEILHKSNSIGYMVEESLVLESGYALQNHRIQYTTYGVLNADKSNVIWVFHALTANSEAAEWWSGLIGEGCLFNPDEHFIVCANMLGSCYGSTEPTDFQFPVITIRDLVKAHKKLFRKLELKHIKIGIGGSMGGQQLLEWAVEEPDLFKTIVPIATNVIHSPWGIAFNEAQRMAMSNSPKGIEVARAIAMLSYRNYKTYELTQQDIDHRVDDFSASSYQRYQGSKLADRFSIYSYYFLSKAMDSHNVGRHYGGLNQALARIKSKAIVIGIDTDILFPTSEQEFITRKISNAVLRIVSSDYGHDGFLVEAEAIAKILNKELNE